MEVLKFIMVIFSISLIICCGVVFSICVILDFIEHINLAKLKKKWAAEQEQAKINRDIKLGYCKKCLYRMNGINYFGYPCIYNLEWLCEGLAAPENPITIEVTRSKDMVEVTRCKDCINREDNQCCILKEPIRTFDWFCPVGKKKGDK